MPRPSVLSRRNPHLHKTNFGHVLIVAGSPTMLGASALCSLAAMRSGAGLVTAAVPKNLNLTLQKKLTPVVMTLPVPVKDFFSMESFNVISKALKKFNAVAIGPGLGRNASTINFVHRMIKEVMHPMVVDADGITALAGRTEVLKKAQGVRVLTPHPGEMSSLTGLSIKSIEADRENMAIKFAQTHKCIVVLKGHRTVIADFKGGIAVNKTGNVGMATAGSGDVLTGIIAAFLAQGIEPFEAARFGAYYHGLAGDQVLKNKSKVSLIATDIIDQLTQVFK